MRPLVRCYVPDPTLSGERQLAVDAVFHSLKTEAVIYLDRGLPQLARLLAADCRRLVSAFGVRLAQRREISVAQREQILASLALTG